MQDALWTDLVAVDGPFPGRGIASVRSVGGGCIHQARRVTFDDGDIVFVKAGASSALPMFEVESDALNALHEVADAQTLVVPRPLGVWSLTSGAVLVLPWLDLQSSDQTTLGRGLALLHRASASAGPDRFGWHRDGFIGAGVQPGGWRKSWGDAFVDLRLRPQLILAKRWGLADDGLDALLVAISTLLNGLEVSPCLVHGDLWGGNAGCLSDGRGTIYDPATWWADHEVDLAMTHLFGGFSSAFYAGYSDVLPTRPGAAQRVDLYNLYHVLNHANLFGGSYRQESQDTLRALARQLL